MENRCEGYASSCGFLATLALLILQKLVEQKLVEQEFAEENTRGRG
jgi:hypothetical protein